MSIDKRTEKWAVAAAATMILALLAVAAFAQSAGFRFFGPLSRVITPNGDTAKANGTAVFCVDNPAQSDVSGKIYTLLGAEVATLSSPTANDNISPKNQCSVLYGEALAGSGEFLTWDGRSNGAVVHSGLYVYRITAELHVYSGTIIVVR